MRVGLPLLLPTLALGVSFGVLARPVMGPAAPIAMSILVFSGAAQFAALSVLAAGGGALAAITAGMLLNARWLPMGFAIGPSLRGGPLARAAQGLTIVDASFVIASRGDGTFDRGLLMGATAVQGVAWVSGTVIGVARGAGARRPEQPGPRCDLRGLLPRAALRGGPQPPRDRGRAGRRRHRLRPHALHAARRADHRRVARGPGRPAEHAHDDGVDRRRRALRGHRGPARGGAGRLRRAQPVGPRGGRRRPGRAGAPRRARRLRDGQRGRTGRRARRPPGGPRRRRRWRSSCACPCSPSCSSPRWRRRSPGCSSPSAGRA